MKKNVILILTPVVLLFIMLISGYNFSTTSTNYRSKNSSEGTFTGIREANKSNASEPGNWKRMEGSTRSAGSTSTVNTSTMIAYALSLIGAPYQYAGITPAGFDCSGFVTHVFGNYNIEIPHSSALQAGEGRPVTKFAAAPGDLVIFTGTNENVREPGHVGIVISEPGDTITFVHSSSNGGVKISKVQGTRYDVRFLEVRRVL